MPVQDQRSDDRELDRGQWGESSPPVKAEELRKIAAGGSAEVEGERIKGRSHNDKGPGHPARRQLSKQVPDHHRMVAHPGERVHVAALSTSTAGFLTVDSQAGRIDPETIPAAACDACQPQFSMEVDR